MIKKFTLAVEEKQHKILHSGLVRFDLSEDPAPRFKTTFFVFLLIRQHVKYFIGRLIVYTCRNVA